MPDRSSSAGHRHRSRSRGASLLSVFTLVIAIAALAAAGWTLYRTEWSPQPSYTDAQRAEAKAKVCAAMDVVRRGVSLNTNLTPAGGPEDVTGTQAVAANARVSLYDGGQYLLARLDPAAPPDLADKVREFANHLMDIGAAATAGAQSSDPEQAARLSEADATNNTITELCR